MSERNDGGPAFPESYYATSESDAPSFRIGMSLRDWLAGQALAGIGEGHNWDAASRARLVEEAYVIADAMLAHRDQKHHT